MCISGSNVKSVAFSLLVVSAVCAGCASNSSEPQVSLKDDWPAAAAPAKVQVAEREVVREPAPVKRPAAVKQYVQRVATKPTAKPQDERSARPQVKPETERTAKLDVPQPMRKEESRPVAPAPDSKPLAMPAAPPPAAPPAATATKPPAIPPAASPAVPQTTNLTCPVEDTTCVERLAAMLSDPTRAWVITEPGPLDYTTGLRLYAFYAERNKLTCPELLVGLTEAKATVEKIVAAMQNESASLQTKVRMQKVQEDALVIQAHLAEVKVKKCADRMPL